LLDLQGLVFRFQVQGSVFRIVYLGLVVWYLMV